MKKDTPKNSRMCAATMYTRSRSGDCGRPPRRSFMKLRKTLKTKATAMEKA